MKETCSNFSQAQVNRSSRLNFGYKKLLHGKHFLFPPMDDFFAKDEDVFQQVFYGTGASERVGSLPSIWAKALVGYRSGFVRGRSPAKVREALEKEGLEYPLRPIHRKPDRSQRAGLRSSGEVRKG